MRGEQLRELVAAAAPLYAKFGLRNSRPLYPSGMHIDQDAAMIAREKVRRAQIALEWLDRSSEKRPVQSSPGAEGLGVPRPS